MADWTALHHCTAYYIFSSGIGEYTANEKIPPLCFVWSQVIVIHWLALISQCLVFPPIAVFHHHLCFLSPHFSFSFSAACPHQPSCRLSSFLPEARINSQPMRRNIGGKAVTCSACTSWNSDGQRHLDKCDLKSTASHFS